jgi:sulfide:quinone oxidoreductase
VLYDGERLVADEIVCLPLLEGPRLTGLPCDDDGFIPVDAGGRVPGVADVYAAGDVTAARIRQGGLACRQADAVAHQLAAAAGAPVEPAPYDALLEGVLMTGGRELFLRSDAAADVLADHPLWWPPAKVAGRYLSSFLADRHALALKDETAPHLGVALPLDQLS